MTKEVKTFFSVMLAASLFLGLLSAPALADSGSGASKATAQLNFQINIPTILYLQVGSAAGVDTVICNLNTLPGTPVAMNNGLNPVPVIMRAIVPKDQPVKLTADSSSGLAGPGDTIPFSQISWNGGAAWTATTFNGNIAQPLYTFAGPGERREDISFTYANSTIYAADTYTGTVTYTLSSP